MPKKNKSAQDIFNSTNCILKEYGLFMKQFPSVESVVVNYQEVMGLSTFCPAHRESHRLSGNQNSEFLACSNPRCHKGGARIGEIIRDMVRVKCTEKTGSVPCAGDEYSEGGKPCLHSFDYVINIIYTE